MAAPLALSGAGFRHLQVYQLYTTNGLPYATAAGATAYSGVQVALAKTFAPAIPEAQVIQITGDDRPAGQIVLAGNETINAPITVAKEDFTVAALLGAVSVVTVGDQVQLLWETDKRGCEIDVGILGYQQSIDNVAGSATRGQVKWRAIWIPKAKIVASAGGMEEGNPMEMSYMAYAQVVNAYLWGLVFVSGTEGATEAQMISAHYNGPPVLDTWLIDAVPLLVLDLSETCLADEAGTGFDMQVYLWANATGLVTNITGACTPSASDVTTVGPVEDDLVMAVYSKAGCP